MTLNRLYIVVLLTGTILAGGVGSADGATLIARGICAPFEAECAYIPAVIYTAGAERNRVVVSGSQPPLLERVLPLATIVEQHAVVLYDPGVPISAGPVEAPGPSVPSLPGGALRFDVVPVSATHSCVSPTAKSVGVCFATAGRWCSPYGSCYSDVGRFGLVELQLGDGDDSLRIAPGSVQTYVQAGAGDDKINARNRWYDRIDCGDGYDTVLAEPGYDYAEENCEVVKYTPV